MTKDLRTVFKGAAAFAGTLALLISAEPGTALAALSAPRLGTAAAYSVLAGSTVTNTGPTVVNGNLGLSPGSAVTGFPPGSVAGYVDINDGAAIKAKTDLVTAYDDIAGATPFIDKSGVDLGSQTLTPGAYHFSSSAQLTGTLTLDGQGQTNPLFLFQIGSSLTTASASRVVLINGANACNLFWQVTSSATLGTGTAFQGTLVALASITLTTGASVGAGGGVNGGRVLARNGAVTMDSNSIVPPAACTLSRASIGPLPPGVVAAGGPAGTPLLPDTGAPTRPPGFPWLPILIVAGILTALGLSLSGGRRRRS